MNRRRPIKKTDSTLKEDLYMKTITGTAITPNGFCGFGYVDEGLPKDEAIAKLKLQMKNNMALRMFLSRLPKEKRKEFINDIIQACTRE